MNTVQMAQASLEGWVAGLIATGYEKSQTVNAGSNTLTIYQHPKLGKIVIHLIYGDTGDWVAFYPGCGCWKGQYHHLDQGEGAKWVEAGPDEFADLIVKVMNRTS